MKKFLKISFFLLFTTSFSGCEKVIEFDLSDAKKVIVIEAAINNRRIPVTVKVSMTSPYFLAGSENPVSGAKVSIHIDKGSSVYFTETKPGIYTLEDIVITDENWYNIDVEYDGKKYSARSYMPKLVPIADLQITYFDGLGLFDSGYKIVCFVIDPPNEENYYRFKYSVNGKPVDDHGDISVYSDKLFNGEIVGLTQGAFVFQKTDTLTVEMQSIDKAAYQYFSTLRTITATETLQSASPSNPISNFNNGALGYFSVYTYERRRLIIKDYIK